MTGRGEQENQTITQLRATVTNTKLPATVRQRGGKLLERLISPVRISILGLPGSGKTELMNLIAGGRIVPAGVQYPSFELTHGDQLQCFVADTTEVEVAQSWPTPDGFDWSQTTMVRLQHPDCTLRDIALIEVVTDGTDEDLQMAAEWAAERSELALWCTQGFGPAEQAAWANMPDKLKDHGFLVVTKADELVAAGQLAPQLDALAHIVADEFHSLFPVATLQYLNALSSGQDVTPKMRAASGAAALLDEVMSHVAQGRQSDLDGAMYFLNRYGVDPGAATDTASKPAPKPAPKVEPAKLAQKQPVPAVHSAEETPEWMKVALDYAGKRGRELANFGPDAEEKTDKIVSHCTQTVEHIAELAADATGKWAALQEELEEASEMLILMQLETGLQPAADATTLLLQLTRELALPKVH